MAFFLAAVPEFLEATAAIGTGVAEVTGSEAVGTAVQGAVAGKAGEAANSVFGSFVEGAAQTIFGKENVAAFEKKTEKAKQLASSFYDYTVGGTYMDKRPDPLKTFVESQQPKKPKDDNCKCEHEVAKKEVKDTGKDLGTFISKTATELAFGGETGKNPITSVLTKVAGNNPLLSYLVPSVIDFQSKLTMPTNERYLEIARVYNGKNLTHENVLETINPDGTRDYSAKDETGQVFTWFGKWNTHKVVPTIWGTYVGINSPNNTKPVSLIDLFAFFHDTDYKLYGFANETADYKFLSRIYNNLDRFGQQEKEIALIAARYFSTVGIAARAYAGNNTTELSPIKDSFVPMITDVPKEPVQQEELRKEFTDGMIEGIIAETHSTSPFATSNNRILNLIDNLEISLE